MGRKFLPLNEMLEAMVEHHILSLLIQLNPNFAEQLYYKLAMTVHSIEIVDTDLLVAHIEQWLTDYESKAVTKRCFCQVELEIYFADLTLFNNPEEGDNEVEDYDDECLEYDDFV